MMFTKQHCRAIAKIVKELIRLYHKEDRPFGPTAYVNGVESLTSKLADCFAQDNPQFNRQNFLKACGLK